MCGRYSLAIRPGEARRRLQQESHMPSQDAPEDEASRATHNFAPGYYGLVYRASTSDRGAGHADDQEPQSGQELPSYSTDGKPPYKLQAMKWGLVPFWTKRNPDYGSMMRTINCRDDSLATAGGMWNSMKQKKRCIVIAQGFYEWLKKDGGKTKVPHFVKRKDGQLMCLAGLWDCVKYEDATDKLYTYTIVTTDANAQLTFLHDRMPVILDNGSEDMFTWLDANRSEWSRDLQTLLRPYRGDLECYPVSKEVGKVGNDSASFIVPLDSTENRQNIANFFGNQKRQAHGEVRKGVGDAEEGADKASRPVPASTGDKRKADAATARATCASPAKRVAVGASSKKRSASSNGSTAQPGPTQGGSQKITSFFGK